MALPLIAVVGVAVFGYTTMQAVKVDGPSYAEIIQTKDLVGDVAAPPEFLVESFLVVRQLSIETDPNQIALLTDRLHDLHATYEERHDYWEQHFEGDASVRFALLTDSYAPAQEFWTVVDDRFLPAVADGDRGEAVQLTDGPIERAYERHQDAVDRVVRLALAQQQAVQADTSALVERRTDILVAIVAVVAVAGVALAALVVRSIRRPLQAIEDDLPRVARELEDLDLTQDLPEVALTTVTGHDELSEATAAFNSVVHTAVELAAEQARVRQEMSETYLHLGRRNQNLVRRMLSFVSDLEQNERDAEALEHLFKLDHLATRMRRNAESLLVLAGADAARTWSSPVPMLDVVRGAVSEIEDFGRVEVAALEPAAVVGTAASDVTHLLAELLENATAFSPPTAKVQVHGRRREDGYVVSIVDHGIGMNAEQLAEARSRLAHEEGQAPTKMLGLRVVGLLADRHRMKVHLTENPSGGTVAQIWMPFGLVGPLPGPVHEPSAAERAEAAAADSAPSAMEPMLVRTAGEDPAGPAAPKATARTNASPGPAGPSGASGATGAHVEGVRLPTLAPADARSFAADLQVRPRPPDTPSKGPRPAGADRRADEPPRRRSADEVRANLARLQSGVDQARRHRSAPQERDT